MVSLGIGAENGDTSKGLRFVADRIGAARGYDPSIWPLDEAVHEISQAAGTKAGQYVYVVLGTDSQDFNSNNVQLAATNAKLPLGIGTTAYTDDKAELDKMIGQSDVYLYRGGGQAENNGYNLLRERGRRVARRLGFGETLSNLKFPDARRSTSTSTKRISTGRRWRSSRRSWDASTTATCCTAGKSA